MKKFITRSLFAFVIMGYALVSVNAATEFTYEGWKDGSGYGTKEQYTDYITTMTGEYNDTAGMFYGPYNKESEQTLEEGINEELLIDLDFDNMGLNELFEISLAFNDANGDYLDEVVVMTQLFEEGKINFWKEQHRFLASEILYYYKLYGIIGVADFYTYLNDKKELLGVLNEALDLDLNDEVEEKVILDYAEVIKEKRTKQEIERLKKTMEEKNDPLEKAKIAEKIRKLKMGS